MGGVYKPTLGGILWRFPMDSIKASHFVGEFFGYTPQTAVLMYCDWGISIGVCVTMGEGPQFVARQTGTMIVNHGMEWGSLCSDKLGSNVELWIFHDFSIWTKGWTSKPPVFLMSNPPAVSGFWWETHGRLKDQKSFTAIEPWNHCLYMGNYPNIVLVQVNKSWWFTQILLYVYI